MNAKVVIFLVDGMRPDSLSETRTPVMMSLRARGASSSHARTIMPSVTLPCIFSLFAGAPPAWHGVDSNLWKEPVNPTPMLFEIVHASGGRTLSVYNWEQLRDLAHPGVLDGAIFIRMEQDNQSQGDFEVARVAVEWLGTKPIDLSFVYLGAVDEVGHVHGWMSPAYLQAVAAVDQAIGKVIEALPADTYVIVTADHGGHERAHGYDMPEDMTIPLILVGPRFPAGTALPGEVSILDIAPTVADILGLPRQAHWQGKSLFE
jgi:predicted AlkP superfamily pyrophosphatase or phosphodiesterase